jgi:hypothetical protein
VFIYTGAMLAFIIPRSKVRRGDLERLVEEVRSRADLRVTPTRLPAPEAQRGEQSRGATDTE